MAIGILLSGGVGERMGAKIPKQFLEVNNKPIILYPLETMENHPEISAIEIVCVKDYIDTMWDIVNKNHISKVKWITEGGATCQESTKKGIDNLKNKINKNEIILIHMSSYPLASAKIMHNCINSAIENGNGCTARPILYSVYTTDDKQTSTQQIDRDKLMLCTVPYAFRFEECANLYDLAFAEGKGITGNVFTNTLYCDYGKKIFFTEDSKTNMKVTTPEDITLMKAYLTIVNKEKNNE